MRPLAFAAVILALAAFAALGRDAADAAETCEARPAIERFFATLAAGDAAAVEALFAQESDGWAWYAIADPAGQRHGDASKDRGTLGSYFEARITQRERLTLLLIDENEGGNFGIRVQRRADDLRAGKPVTRLGKGRVSCDTGKINVFLLGGAPPPSTFGRCPQSARPLPRDLRPAGAAVLAFLRTTYSDMSPALDVRGARITALRRAPGIAAGYAARVRCGREVQRRTAVATLRLPRVAAGQPNASLRFYVSRVQSGWLVWRLV